jgi:hypothetical protein
MIRRIIDLLNKNVPTANCGANFVRLSPLVALWVPMLLCSSKCGAFMPAGLTLLGGKSPMIFTLRSTLRDGYNISIPPTARHRRNARTLSPTPTHWARQRWQDLVSRRSTPASTKGRSEIEMKLERGARVSCHSPRLPFTSTDTFGVHPTESSIRERPMGCHLPPDSISLPLTSHIR